jgi:CBS-domain-containing membrane protein
MTRWHARRCADDEMTRFAWSYFEIQRRRVLARLTSMQNSLPHLRDLDRQDDCLGSLIPGPALTIAESARTDAARHLLVEHRVAALAVLDDRDELRGLVTRTDVLRATAPSTPVSELMSMFIVALPWSASIHRAAALIAYEGVGQVVVTGIRSSLLGIVSAFDITRYFALAAHAR